MIIRSVELENFRNFIRKKVEFCDDINIIFGLNGYGKTNLLEAISVICLTKSFRNHSDNNLVRFDQNKFNISAEIILDTGVQKKIQILYDPDHGKRISIDYSRISVASELIGSFPIVVLAPEDDLITFGAPQERRRFINLVLSQLNKDYLRLLQEYVRIVKHRNKLLQDARENRYKFSEKIEPWNEELYIKSKAITENRASFLTSLEQFVGPIHNAITSYLEEFSIHYKPSFNLEWNSFEKYRQVLDKNINYEIIKGSTIIGPHRDEILFLLNGKELRKYGSRGQHRCCLLAIKIAEYKLLRAKKAEAPIFLLDDVYSEIDEVREKALNEYFLELKQIFLTTHETDIQLHMKRESEKEIKYCHIQNNSFSPQRQTV